jgi:hypothetical protein
MLHKFLTECWRTWLDSLRDYRTSDNVYYVKFRKGLTKKGPDLTLLRSGPWEETCCLSTCRDRRVRHWNLVTRRLPESRRRLASFAFRRRYRESRRRWVRYERCRRRENRNRRAPARWEG